MQRQKQLYKSHR